MTRKKLEKLYDVEGLTRETQNNFMILRAGLDKRNSEQLYDLLEKEVKEHQDKPQNIHNVDGAGSAANEQGLHICGGKVLKVNKITTGKNMKQ